MQVLSASASLQKSTSLVLSTLGDTSSGDTTAPASPIEQAAKQASDVAVIIDRLDDALGKNRGDHKAPTYSEPGAAKLAKAANGRHLGHAYGHDGGRGHHHGQNRDGGDGSGLSLTSLSYASSQTSLIATNDFAAATASQSQLQLDENGLFYSTASLSLTASKGEDGSTTISQSYSVSRTYVGTLDGFGQYADQFA
ncbi:hypothetical protein HDIA_4054 [Hartmannibacter diazotrophicus]|uniref:Uncharacterized protein n=1 Tax=Hartmannibacter diazotrophicus TaxID=1482074 RepID=A0A2C9DDA2_9HYPH|nr:hypothetical protein [Hartmannibacter diazotrophicus]SON57595.1 hypothetical protein HDIA_4054 [Hartmannibacter diazotrophicus]